MLNKPFPVLESVTLWGAVVEPVFSGPSVRLVVEMLTTGAVTGGAGLPPPPPPQATQAPKMSNAPTPSQLSPQRRDAARPASTAKANQATYCQGTPIGGRKVGGAHHRVLGDFALTCPEVVTVNVVVTAEAPSTFTDVEEKLHVAPGGQSGPTPRYTVPVNPFRGVIVIVEVPDCPGDEILSEVGFTARLKSVTVIVSGGEIDGA